MEKLKECPFCGGEAYQPVNMEWSDNVYDDWVIDCKECGARVFNVTPEEVVTSWNTRYHPKHDITKKID